MTEVRYTDIDKDKKMPSYMPMAVVGGDIKHMTYLIDKVMKGDYSAVVSSSIIYNTLIQMKTQIDLFYKILLQQKNRYSNSPSHLSKEDQIKFNNKVDIYNNNVSVLKSTKNIIDQIVEANDPFIKRAKPDSIHNKLQDICREIAEENGVED